MAMLAEGLRSSRSTERLNKIDKIKANGIGNHISLPQLVVCGDQSSGKSSTLERLTGIPFPRQEGLCTRFPTEIILRHSNEPLQLSASIQPSSRRSVQEQKTLRGYQRKLSELSELPEIINESAALMGIRGYGSPEPDHGNAFAHDVLRIEVVGPVGLHLTIVDLPGLISVSNDEQTEEDIGIVTDLVESYLRSSRTIIMAVVQASNDAANQPIIQLARKHDLDGERTVGIITKPDLINEGAEGKIAKLAKNEDSVKLRLGFFLMKNPSPAEMTKGLTAEEVEKALFSNPAWRAQNLDMNRVGVNRLRLYLQELLDAHIEKEIPSVRSEIRLKLTATEKDLSLLGPERSTVGEIRAYLIQFSMKFHQLAQDALGGNYQGLEQVFFADPGTRLRAVIKKANTGFAESMCTKGQKRTVKGRTGTDDNGHGEGGNNSTEQENLHSNTESTFEEDPLQRIYVSENEMAQWVHTVCENTRGHELPGNHNHVLLAELFHEQSSPWSTLAAEHVESILKSVSQWINHAIRASVQDEAVHRQVSSLCKERLEQARTQANIELGLLIADEKSHPVTYNHYYTDNVQKARQDKQQAAITQVVKAHTGTLQYKQGSVVQTVNQEQLLGAMHSQIIVNMEDQTCSDALVELKAYYKVAIKTFIDNVCRQVIERHITSVLPTLFSPQTVAKFTDDDLLRIGSEAESNRVRRAELHALARGLRQSLTDLQA